MGRMHKFFNLDYSAMYYAESDSDRLNEAIKIIRQLETLLDAEHGHYLDLLDRLWEKK